MNELGAHPNESNLKDRITKKGLKELFDHRNLKVKHDLLKAILC